MKRPYQVVVDLGDALHPRLEKLEKASGKTKSELVKIAVLAMCNAEVADISIDTNILNKLINSKSSTRRKPSKLGDKDWELVATWKKVFGLPEKTRIFAPAILNVIWNARTKGNLSQEELTSLIEVSPRNRWVREQVRAGVVPPLSSILSEKMIPHLMALERDGGDGPTENLDEYKLDTIDKHWEYVTESVRDQFRDHIMGCYSAREVDATVMFYDKDNCFHGES